MAAVLQGCRLSLRADSPTDLSVSVCVSLCLSVSAHVLLDLCVCGALQELEITELCYAEAKLAQKPETVI